MRIILNTLVKFTQLTMFIEGNCRFIGIDPNAVGVKLLSNTNLLVPNTPLSFSLLAHIRALQKSTHNNDRFLEFEIQI